MKNNKIIGWTVLCLHAVILFLIFQFDVLGEWRSGSLTISLFTLYTLATPSLAWYLICKEGKSHNM